MSDTFQQKTERNFRVQARYTELEREGKHGHYETIFRIVREEIERERERCAKIADMRAAVFRGSYGVCALSLQEECEGIAAAIRQSASQPQGDGR